MATLPLSALALTTMLAPAAVAADPASQTLSTGRSQLSEFETLGTILDASYASLSDRVRPSGFAPTSVKESGGYSGMFVRDSSIQAMAMQAAGEPGKARDVIQYIASFGQVRNSDRAPRVLPNESYVVGASLPEGLAGYTGQYQWQANAGTAYRVTGGNKVAQKFTLRDSTLDKVRLVLWSDAGQTGSVRVSVRSQRDSDVELAYGELTGSGLPTENATQWQEIPLTTVSAHASQIEADTELWLVIESTSSVRYGLTVANTVKAPLSGMENYEGGSWRTTGHTLAFAINDVPTADEPLAVPNTVAAGIGGDVTARQTISASQQLGSISVALRAATTQPGDVVLVASDDTGIERTVTIPASQITADASWYDFTFPAVGISTTSTDYTLRLQAPQAAAGSIELLGTAGAFPQAPGGLDLVDGAGEHTTGNTAAFQAASLNYSGEDMSNQPDGNYMFILAWARYINAFPNDTQFIKETYPTVSQWANYYLKSEYWNDATNPDTGKPMNLLYNPEFESSRKNSHLRGYDLITNVFAAQALRELSAVAAIAGESQSVIDGWHQWVTKIETGINENLVVERNVAGQTKKIYREMY